MNLVYVLLVVEEIVLEEKIDKGNESVSVVIRELKIRLREEKSEIFEMRE